MKLFKVSFVNLYLVAALIILPFFLTAQIIHTERADATFTVGEPSPAVFVVTDTAGGDFLGGDLNYEIYLDADGEGTNFKTLFKLDSGSVYVPTEGTGNISFTYDQPGVISCRIKTGKNDQDPIASVAYSPFEIKQLEEEGDFLDFDGFWANAKNQLAQVPYGEPQPLMEYPDSFNLSTSYRINLGNINGRRVYGFLTVPNNDGPYGAGPYPAMVQLPPYGDNLFHPNIPPNTAEITGIVHLSISIHNTEADVQDPNAYVPTDNLEFADSNYYKQAVLAGVRAIDYLYDRPDVIKEKIGVMGVSQGGGLAVMVAGIDDRVKYLMASNPAGSEHLGKKFNTATGYPKFLYRQENLKPDATEYEKQKWLRNVKYYDILNFAKRYNGPASIFVGYEDVICPARGTFAVFNMLSGPKILAHETNQGHNHGVYSNTFPTWIARHLDTDAKFAFGDKGYYINLGVDKDVPFGKKIPLEAIVEHESFLYTANFTYEWSQVSGPGKVNFSNSTKKITNANFSQEGNYRLQLRAVDKSQLIDNKYFFTLIDEIEINVIDSTQCLDVDEDGICATSDCDDNNALVPDLPGKRCSDNLEDTAIDVIQEDNCSCMGIQRVLTTTCGDNEEVTIVYGSGQIEVTANPGEEYIIKIFKGSDLYDNEANEFIKGCTTGTGLCNTILAENLEEGDYVIQVFTQFPPECLTRVYLSPTIANDNNGGEDPDNDNDGFPASQDCNDFDSNVKPVNYDRTCDDGDPYTQNDMILANTCACIGQYIGSCSNLGGDQDNDGICDDNDCDPSDFNVGAKKPLGTPCDDGDFNTKNDVYIDGCTCQGEPIDSTDTGGGTTPSSTLWTLSNDKNYIYREGKTEAIEFWADKLMVKANLSTNNLFNNEMPLEGLRGYIQENKHLPNIPKAATVINNGLNVGLLSVLRMAKIKELTSYLLEMNKRLEELEGENQDLKRLDSDFNDCDNVTVNGGNDGTITFNNVITNSKIEIYGTDGGTSWIWVTLCEGNCNGSIVENNLDAGNYDIKIQAFDQYCFKQTSVSVTTGGGGNSNPCDGQGGDTDGDGICNNQDNCDNTPNPNQIDSDGDGIGDLCEDNGGNNGGGSTSNGSESCKNFNISTEGTTVTISGMNDPTTKIEYNGPSTSYGLVLVCEGGNCGSQTTITGLTAGEEITIKAQTYSSYCYEEYTVTVGSGNNSGGGNNSSVDTTTIGLWTANHTDDYIFRKGKVMVMDTFMAEKIIVEVLDFPDYVFEKDYPLMPLDELQEYISTNKHLPNIPKGEKVEMEGMNIGDISILQMEKIEELTLYLLEMNERLKHLEKANHKLKKKRNK